MSKAPSEKPKTDLAEMLIVGFIVVTSLIVVVSLFRRYLLPFVRF